MTLPTLASPRRAFVAALAAALFATAVVRTAPQPQSASFTFLAPGYAQHLFATTASFSKGSILGGVVVLQGGDVIAAECATDGTVLHRFSATTTAPDPDDGQLVHAETLYPTTGGCGIALGLDGYIYSNVNDPKFGVAKIDPNTGAVITKFTKAPTGNALGIATNPVTGHLVYAGQSCRPVANNPPTCTLYDLDPASGKAVQFIALNTQQFLYVDGLEYEPTGAYLFATNRAAAGTPATTTITKFDLIVMSGQLGGAPPPGPPPPGPAVLQDVVLTVQPIGMAFNGGTPKFVVTDNQDGTLTRFDFPGDDYTKPPSQAVFASDGFRGDLMQVGPDTCLYVTQDGVRYDDGYKNQSTNSIVQVCDGFATPPGVTPAPPALSSLAGFVFNDANDNGAMDTGEAPIAGVTISLTGTDDLGRPVTLSTTTAADGSYSFAQLHSGVYSIAETQPSGYFDGTDTQGTPGTGAVVNDAINNIDLRPGVTGTNNNFGELLASSLGGYVYVDANNNGKMESNESGIAGVVVTLTGTDDRGAAISMPATTGADGSYTFANLRPGSYALMETGPAGYVDGKDAVGTSGGTLGNDAITGISLAAGASASQYDFGETVAVVTDKIAPTCSEQSFKGPPFHGTMTFQDAGTGLKSLTIVKNVNFSVTMPAFKAGTKSPVTVAATIINQRRSAVLTITATDMAGNSVTCDPVETTLTVTKLKQLGGIQFFTDIPESEHLVTVDNGNPGLDTLEIVVNGRLFQVHNLADDGTKTIDIASALHAGNNFVMLIPLGSAGDSADIVISDH